MRVLSGIGPVPGEDGNYDVADLDEDQVRAILDSLRQLDRRTLARELDSCARSSASDRTTLGILRVLARYGDSEDLRLAVHAANSRQQAGGMEPGLHAALRETVRRILGRDPRGYTSMTELLRRADEEVAYTVAVAVADAGLPRGLDTLTTLLGWKGEFNAVLLRQVGRLAAVCEAPAGRPVLAVVRSYLHSDEPREASEAAIASGRLEDFDALEPLIGLLRHADPVVQGSAAWSLSRMSGLSYPPDPTAWRAWLATEEEWMESVAPRLVRGLGDRDPAIVMEALNEFSRRRYRRDFVAGWITAVLDRGSAPLRRLACTALGRLGSKAAIPALTRCMGDSDLEVASEAMTSLKAITGRDLPPDPGIWTTFSSLDAGDRPSRE
ncbi:MAG: HEAT repeat domain-containing protein [Planctomycetota bacterium]